MEVPVVRVKNSLIIKSCPYCKKKHSHGVGIPEGPIYGQRMAQCLKGVYYLIPK